MSTSTLARRIPAPPQRATLATCGMVGGLAREAAHEAAQEIASGHRVTLHGQSRTQRESLGSLARMMRANPHVGVC